MKREETGAGAWISCSRVLATPWASETSGGFPTSVTEMAEVSDVISNIKYILVTDRDQKNLSVIPFIDSILTSRKVSNPEIL